MSRIGKLPLELPKGVEVKLGADVVEVKGPKGTLTTPRCASSTTSWEDGHLTLTRLEETREARAQHGLRCTLVANCVKA